MEKMFRISAMLLLYVCSATAAFSQMFGGLMIPSLESQYPCISGATTVVNVTNPTTGKVWMDRNLGAAQVATSATDAAAYGDLYQWGRRSDGHQCRNSATTATLSSTDTPAHGLFITTSSSPNDWRNPQNVNLWQGVNGVNNPCPVGYRLPTSTELNAERLSWIANNSTGAFGSPLKWPLTGAREISGSIGQVGTIGFCWSSSAGSVNSSRLLYSSGPSGDANVLETNCFRAYAFPVRCIKN